jgi:phosphatidylglycerophosphatase B
LLAGVYAFPIAFTACSPNSQWCNIAFLLTSSGGTAGFFGLVLITGFCYTLRETTLKNKIRVFIVSISSLVIFFGALAFINEKLTKPILRSQRPSHVFMLNQTGHSTTIDSLYQLSKKEREGYFAELIKNNPLSFNQIDTHIQEHWVEEAGFSFPSGHTFNAFLFAMIIAYAIYHNTTWPHLQKLFFVPFIWALAVGISRVAMGAHTAFDVSVGSALGIMIGALFLYIDKTRRWLTRK